MLQTIFLKQSRFRVFRKYYDFARYLTFGKLQQMSKFTILAFQTMAMFEWKIFLSIECLYKLTTLVLKNY